MRNSALLKNNSCSRCQTIIIEPNTMKPLPVLLPFSFIYGFVIALRNLFFEKKLLSSVQAPVPVISVGNITSGGTGKTPIVELIAAMFLRAHKRPAIVSRGYGRLTTGFVLVSDGAAVHATADAAGDEAYQMAKKLSGVVVIDDEKRARGAAVAAGSYNADVVILDDGFQHRALRRDCDIVLIDAEQDVFSMPMLPAGHRREQLSSLHRADAVIITKCTPRTDSTAIAANIRRITDAPVFTSSYGPVSCVDCRTGAVTQASSLRGMTAVVFCGIGQPESFRRSVEELGITIASFHAYGDHHRYSRQDLQNLAGAMAAAGAGCYLTTEKDARRLDGAFDPREPVLYLAMEARVHEAEQFSALIFSCVPSTQR
jgi:tetraacyldisaccharide 4'-kinase